MATLPWVAVGEEKDFSGRDRCIAKNIGQDSNSSAFNAFKNDSGNAVSFSYRS
jgi:hypothetical protein